MSKKKNPGSIFNIDKIQIGGINWDIVPLGIDAGKTLGTCSTPDRHIIKINQHQWNRSNEDYIDTVLHECLHAMSSMKMGKSQLSEFQVSQLAEGFEELILYNPKFVKWLSEYADWVRQERKLK